MPPSHTLQIFTEKFKKKKKTYNTSRYLLTKSRTKKDDALMEH